MKFILTLFLLLVYGLPASAQDRITSQKCRDDSIISVERINACTSLIQTASDDNERSAALVRLGMAHEDNDNLVVAESAYRKALAVRPNYPFALQQLATLFHDGARFGEALETTRLLIDLEPDDAWNHYQNGKTLLSINEYESAILSFDTAVSLDPEYYWAYFRRGQVFDRLRRWEEAGKSYALAAREFPFSRNTQFEAFSAFEDAGIADRAAFHARVLFNLDPNELSLRDWLLEYYSSDIAPDLAPMEWVPQVENLEMRYLRVLAPIDEREETEKAIEELINFFGGKSYPVPDSAIVYTTQRDEIRDDVVVARVNQIASMGESPEVNEKASYFRGLFPIEIFPLGPLSPGVLAVYDGGSPSDIWPLAVGNSASGTGRYVIQCPAKLTPPAIVMGCRSDNLRVDAGTIDWSISIDGTETIHVPFGIFDTYVMRYTQQATISILGVERMVNLDAAFWIAPEVNTWVQRRVVQDSKFLLSQLLEISQVQ